MSCSNNNCYLPQPPRDWSRVQNSCSVITNTDNNGLVIDPYTGQLVTTVVLAERIAMLNKGNVLQYKANSSNLTKAQKYSKIAKGQWVNRNTTWATQSTRGYTNPNTTSLKRTGDIVNIAIDPITGAIIGPTTAPQTCPTPINPSYPPLPSNGGGGSDVKDPDIPPPVIPTPGSDTFPAIIPVTPVEPIVIQDGGSLICTVQENPCTGETKSTISQKCYPTTDSDVPGPIQDLCWNDGTQTWYPRQRYVMTNSANKWPVNAQLVSAVQIYAPYITSVVSNFNIVTLTWTFNDACLPASNFNIYQNGLLVRSVDGNTFTTEFVVNNCNYYQYYVIAENITAKAISEQSNLVGINIAYPEPVTITSVYIINSTLYNLFWEYTAQCDNVDSYNIYINGVFYLSVSKNLTNLIISGVTCSYYSIYIETVYNGLVSLPSNIYSFTLLWPGEPTNLNTTTSYLNGYATIILAWEPPTTNICTNNIINYDVYLDGNLIETNVSSPYTFTNLEFSSITTPKTYTVGVLSKAFITGTLRNSSLVTTPQSTLTPFITTNATVNLVGNVYNIIYTSNGTITFYNTGSNVQMIMVGGGAGGAGGSSSTNDTKGGGGGGGAETLLVNNPQISTGNSYSITIGTGGPGGVPGVSGANAGSPGTATTANFDIIYTATFGGANPVPGGNGGGSYSNGGSGGGTGGAGQSQPGAPGTVVVNGNITSYGGGGGGCGGAQNGNPANASGGGGGGVAYDFLNNIFINSGTTGGLGGGATNNGTQPLGGSYYGANGSQSNGSSGSNASYGGGGGGGSGRQNSGTTGSGGAGGDGYCIISYTYTYP